MSHPWFRMYSDFIFDEKVEFISFEDQRHFVFLLCMKNNGLLDKEYSTQEMFERVVARRLGLFGEAFDAAKKRLVDSGLVDSDWQPINWSKRQFISDTDPTHADRQRKYRERLKNRESDASRDVTVTVLDTETDTETDIKQRGIAVSKKPTLIIPDWLPEDVLQNFKEHRAKMKKPMTDAAVRLFITKLSSFKEAGHDPVECINRSILNGWAGVFEPKDQIPTVKQNDWSNR